MANQDGASVGKPQGFSKWFGRTIAVVFLLAALGTALVYFLQGTTTSGPNPAATNQGIRLQ